MHFTKLFSSILDSTIWQEPAETKVVWICLLAMSDRNGDVFASIPGLASRAKVTIAECETAIACFLAPDPYSRTKDHEGRRIAEIDGGWALLNHAKYRALLSAEERKEYNRRKQAEYRAKKARAVNDALPPVKLRYQKSAMSAHTEAEAEAEAEAEEKNPPTPPKGGSRAAARPVDVSEVEAYAKDLGLPATDGTAFWDGKEGNGWKNGRNPVKDWKATFRNWKQNGWHPSQNQKGLNGKAGVPTFKPKPQTPCTLPPDYAEIEARRRAKQTKP